VWDVIENRALLQEKELLEELRDQVNDRWVWHNDRSGSFSVKEAYKVTVSNKRYLGFVVSYLIWNKIVLLKVVLYAWRLLKDRLPTKDNLIFGDVGNCGGRCCQ
jgi:hypothetical protein